VLVVNRLFSNNTVSLYPDNLSIYALIEGVFAVFPTSVEDNVASGIIFAINSLAILVFMILKGLVDDKANSTGDNSIAFNVATATSDNNAVNKGQLDTELALKPNSTSVTNEINTRIANEFIAKIIPDATL
jgi:hypothetical protein